MDYEFVPGRDDFPPDEIAMLRQQLAAALAACEAKDAALRLIEEGSEFYAELPDKWSLAASKDYCLMLEALAIKPSPRSRRKDCETRD